MALINPKYPFKLDEFYKHFEGNSVLENEYIVKDNQNPLIKEKSLESYKAVRTSTNTFLKNLSDSFETTVGNSPNPVSKFVHSFRTIRILNRVVDQTDKADQAWIKVFSNDALLRNAHFLKNPNTLLIKENQETKELCENLKQKANAELRESACTLSAMGCSTLLLAKELRSRL